jgi:hypothetical protein
LARKFIVAIVAVPFQRCCLPPYQGWQAVVPLFVSLARLAVVPLRGWMVLLQPAAWLEWLYDVAAISVITRAAVFPLVEKAAAEGFWGLTALSGSAAAVSIRRAMTKERRKKSCRGSDLAFSDLGTRD